MKFGLQRIKIEKSSTSIGVLTLYKNYTLFCVCLSLITFSFLFLFFIHLSGSISVRKIFCLLKSRWGGRINL